MGKKTYEPPVALDLSSPSVHGQTTTQASCSAGESANQTEGWCLVGPAPSSGSCSAGFNPFSDTCGGGLLPGIAGCIAGSVAD